MGRHLLTEKEHKVIIGGDEMFNILIVMLITQVFTFIKSYLTVDLKWVHIMYLNKILNLIFKRKLFKKYLFI